MDRIAATQAFTRVVESGSFGKAADSMHVPRPTVTRLVQGLERQIKVRLLHRTTRAMTLTAEGARYYERTVRLLAYLDDIETTARDASLRPSGKIRVDVGVAMGACVLVPALPDFYAKFPDMQIELDVSNRDVDLVAENVDCAVRAGTITDESLVARLMGHFSFVACAAPQYLAAHGVPTHPKELENDSHQTIGMISSRTRQPVPFAFVDEGKVWTPTTKHFLTVNDTNAYFAAATAGMGIIQAPSFAVRREIESGRLVPILPGWQSNKLALSVVYPQNRYLSAKVRIFIDWAIQMFESCLDSGCPSIPTVP